MNKRLLSLCIGTSIYLAVSAQAQQVLISGWDFSYFSTPAFAKVGDVGEDGNGAAFFADPYLDSNHTTVSRTGRIWVDGSFGSTTFTRDGFNLPQVTTNDGSDLINIAYPGNNPLDEDFSTTTTDPQALAFDIIAGSVTFQLNTLSYGEIGFSYAIRRGSQAANTIAWSYSTNGSSFTSISPTLSALTTSYALHSINLSGPSGLGVTAFDNTATIYLKADFAGGTAINNPNSQLAFDNIQVKGVFVPEPSTYVAIAAGLCLAFTILRRRRQA